MKVNELIKALSNMPEDAEVRMAYQPNYPLQVSVGAVTDLTQGYEDDEDGVMDDEDKVVWIASGSATASGYAPSLAWHGSEEW